MTDDDSRRALTRIADARLARRSELDAEASAPAPPPASSAGGFTRGDRVLDRRSGREGTVQHVGEPDRRGDRLYQIAFDGGMFGLRPALDLLPRPTPPPGRS